MLSSLEIEKCKACLETNGNNPFWLRATINTDQLKDQDPEVRPNSVQTQKLAY